VNDDGKESVKERFYDERYKKRICAIWGLPFVYAVSIIVYNKRTTESPDDVHRGEVISDPPKG